MGGGNARFMWVTTSPRNRPVYLTTQEVDSPQHALTDITRCDQYTLVNIHPNSDIRPVAQEIAEHLEPDTELGTWFSGFTALAVDLRALRRDPIGTIAALDPRLLNIRCQATYIPPVLQTPWANL